MPCWLRELTMRSYKHFFSVKRNSSFWGTRGNMSPTPFFIMEHGPQSAARCGFSAAFLANSWQMWWQHNAAISILVWRYQTLYEGKTKGNVGKKKKMRYCFDMPNGPDLMAGLRNLRWRLFDNCIWSRWCHFCVRSGKKSCLDRVRSRVVKNPLAYCVRYRRPWSVF